MYAWDYLVNDIDGEYLASRWQGRLLQYCVIIRQDHKWFQKTKWNIERPIDGSIVFCVDRPFCNQIGNVINV